VQGHKQEHEVVPWPDSEVTAINRWTVEAPHPKLTFDEAWVGGERTPLGILKLYSPTFTNYGWYVLPAT
jgi:hypothetical protein